MTVAQAAHKARLAQNAADNRKGALHHLIRAEAAKGTSKTALAEQAGVSRQTIHNILKETP